jgi:hypothetical protein
MMTVRFKRILTALLTVSIVVVNLMLGLTGLPQSVQAANLMLASVHTYHERPGQTTFRSTQSLRDRTDHTWQLILFKRYDGEQLQGIYLRLVGFPGVAEVVPDQALTLATGTRLQWLVPPALDGQTLALPSNAAQYNVAAFAQDLKGDIPLQLFVPLAGDRTAELVVPPFVVHEWREVIAAPAES